MARRFTPITNSLILAAALAVVALGVIEPALATSSKQQKTAGAKNTPATDTARRYAEAIAKGDRVTVGQLDFACQYRLVVASAAGVKSHPPANDPSYDSCWQTLKTAHAPVLKRDDVGMSVLWPSAGPLAFFGDELPRTPASAFVMDELGISPPGTGLHVAVAKSQSIPDGSFRLYPNG
jgi:hypothetical protein